ncbi:hypothetical protein Trydic_g19687 [Trypoxylus dichotomus]
MRVRNRDAKLVKVVFEMFSALPADGGVPPKPTLAPPVLRSRITIARVYVFSFRGRCERWTHVIGFGDGIARIGVTLGDVGKRGNVRLICRRDRENAMVYFNENGWWCLYISSGKHLHSMP